MQPEPVSGGIDEEQLLVDTDREGWADAEPVIPRHAARFAVGRSS